MSRSVFAATAAALALVGAASGPTRADEPAATPPVAAPKQGLYQPILSDFHTDIPNSDTVVSSAIQFGQIFTGGAAYSYFDGGRDFSSGGLFFRPDLESEDELVLGTSYVKGSDQFELQGKYTLENSLGASAGYFRTGVSGQGDVFFARVNYDVPLFGGKLALSPLAQKNPDRDYDVGAYTLFTNDHLVAGVGYDGEATRVDVNYAFPEVASLKPRAEVFYNDDRDGDVDGSELIISAGTLSYSGGFLAPSNAYGRAAGPTGVTYNNPFSFTSGTWNRGYDVWEYGAFANYRIVSVETAGVRSTDYSAVVYPAQIVYGLGDTPAQHVFVGFRHITNQGGDNSDAPLIGYFGPLFGKFSGALSFYYDFPESQSEVVLGLVYLH